MKPRLLIAPLLVLLAGAGALTVQRREISAAEQQVASHPVRHAAGRMSHDREPQRSRLERLRDPASSLDWRRLALEFSELAAYGDFSRTRLHRFLMLRLVKMSPAEIAAAMDALSALDLAKDEVTPLLAILADDLRERDPELLLGRFPHFISDESLSTPLFGAFTSVLASDLAAALAWLDQQIAAGRFVTNGFREGNRWQVAYEREAIEYLLGVGIDSVLRRLDQLPVRDRPDVFSDNFNVPAGEESAFGKMVREKISGDMQGRVVSAAARGRWDQGGLPAVRGLLDGMNANDECRGEAAIAVSEFELGGQRDGGWEKMDEFRTWTAGAAPEAVGAVTGFALASFANDAESFAEAAARAEAYDVADGDDDALKMFLRRALPSDNREEAERRANAVADPALREKILRRIR